MSHCFQENCVIYEPKGYKIAKIASIFFHGTTEYWIQQSYVRDLLDKGSPGERGMDQLTFFQLPDLCISDINRSGTLT